MLPPSSGDDCLQLGHRFVISLYGTDSVFTAEGNDLRVRPYSNNDNQIWICVRDENNQFGFINRATGKYLGRDVYQHLACYADAQKGWECLTFTKLTEGGYRLSVPVDDKLCPVKETSDSGGPYMMVVAESSEMIGLHQHETAVFRRFRWVTPGQLARSSAPHYNGNDEDQNMDQEAVDFLVSQGIKNVISFNGCPLSAEEMDRLSGQGITYHHIALPDYTAPTLDQLDLLRTYYLYGGTTLIYCGYGQGRTGTGVSALQLYDGRSMSEMDFRQNGVETEDQIKVLNDLKNKLEQ
jgi:hypothetical protein